MKRFLAIAASGIMIILAVVVRSAIDDDGAPKGSGSGGRLVLACVTELEAPCRQLDADVRIEDASVTALAIARGTAAIDGWVTFDPWPEMVDVLAERDTLGDSTRAARTDLVIAMVEERAVGLRPTCGTTGSINWRCLGDAIGRPWPEVGGRAEWGSVKAGLPPASSGAGILALGNAASSFFERTDFATNDFDDRFLVWKAKVTATPGSYLSFIQQFPAAFSAVGTTQAEVTATGLGGRSVAVNVSPPPARVVAVIAPLAGRRVSGLVPSLQDGLRTAGWSTDDLDAPSGLPSPGVLLALSGLTG